MGDAGPELLGIMGNGDTGGVVDDRVRGMGSEHDWILEVGDVRCEGTETGLTEGRRSCRILYEEAGSGGNTLERTATKTVGEIFFDSNSGKKTGHERQSTATNPSAFVHIRRIC